MKYLIPLLLLLLVGCVSGRVEVDQSGICSFEYMSLLKDIKSPDLDLCGATMSAGDSISKDETLKALINAL